MSSTETNNNTQTPEQYTVALNQFNWANLDLIQKLLWPNHSKSWVVQKLITDKHQSLIKQMQSLTQGETK